MTSGDTGHQDIDPYAVFGEISDDDDDEENETQLRGTGIKLNDAAVATRIPECGVLSFHGGTEQALLHFVRDGLQQHDDKVGAITVRERILKLVDHFCFSRHWMMHVGPDKGAVLEGFLTECYQSRQGKNNAPFVLAEIGTYCGYSCIRMANILLQQYEQSQQTPDFHIFTVDVNPENQKVAKQLAALAGLEDFVTFILLQDPTAVNKQLSASLMESLKEKYPDRTAMFDFVFIDHDKDAYFADLLQLEQQALIRAGTHVAADNVIFFGLNAYRQHMKALEDRGIVTTRLVTGTLEYVDGSTCRHEVGDKDVTDGIELTVYLQDPWN